MLVDPGFEGVDMQRVRAALDLGRRLSKVPLHAHVRGFLFKQTADEVERGRAGAVVAYRRLTPVKSTWFFRMYSVRAYLEDVTAAAAVVAPEDPASAVRAIWRNGPRYAPLFNAVRFLGFLRSDVLSAARWLETHRSFFADYGRWRIEPRTDRYFIMHYFDEWIWIDSAHRGGLEGLLQACGVEGSVDVDLDTPFDGRLHVRWQAP
ncbi:MAG TPA: hypothetical protein VGG39_11490 [Polyangiaceae bacterium]|jgi:uncharacterized protein (TIGR02265 family)